MLAAEKAAGLHELSGYAEFAARVAKVRRTCCGSSSRRPSEGKTVVGYGAPGKGNTLLNHCGIRADLLAYTVDRNPYKQGRFLPGTHIPILPPERIAADRPDYVLVLPWNLREEMIEQLAYVREWGGRLVFPIPALEHCRGREVDEGRPVLRRLGMRMRSGAADDVPKPMAMVGPRPLIWHVMRYYAHFGHTEFILCLGLRRAPHQGLLPELRGDDVQRLRAARRRGSSCCPPTSPTGRSRSSTPGSSRRSASGCAGSATTSTATRCSWPTTPTCSPTRRCRR